MAHPTKPKVKVKEVIALKLEHPEMTQKQIAEIVGIRQQSVQEILARYHIIVPRPIIIKKVYFCTDCQEKKVNRNTLYCIDCRKKQLILIRRCYFCNKKFYREKRIIKKNLLTKHLRRYFCSRNCYFQHKKTKGFDI